jgi:hypothetical protein
MDGTRKNKNITHYTTMRDEAHTRMRKAGIEHERAEGGGGGGGKIDMKQHHHQRRTMRNIFLSFLLVISASRCLCAYMCINHARSSQLNASMRTPESACERAQVKNFHLKARLHLKCHRRSEILSIKYYV